MTKKKTTKRTKAKKPAAKKLKPPAKTTLKRTAQDKVLREDPSLREFLKLFKQFQGGTRVSELAKDSGHKRPRLRRAFTKLAGGKEAYRKIMSTFERHLPPTRSGPQPERTKPNDSGVRWVRSDKLRKSWEVWSRDEENIYAEPKTDPPKLYRQAGEYETCDVILPSTIAGIRDTRLKYDAGFEKANREAYEKWIENMEYARAIGRGEVKPEIGKAERVKRQLRKEKREAAKKKTTKKRTTKKRVTKKKSTSRRKR